MDLCVIITLNQVTCSVNFKQFGMTNLLKSDYIIILVYYSNNLNVICLKLVNNDLLKSVHYSSYSNKSMYSDT